MAVVKRNGSPWWWIRFLCSVVGGWLVPPNAEAARGFTILGRTASGFVHAERDDLTRSLHANRIDRKNHIDCLG